MLYKSYKSPGRHCFFTEWTACHTVTHQATAASRKPAATWVGERTVRKTVPRQAPLIRWPCTAYPDKPLSYAGPALPTQEQCPSHTLALHCLPRQAPLM